MTKLDRCWKNQLRMSGSVAENWKLGDNVDDMKEEWLKTHGFTRSIDANCFFCEYNAMRGGGIRRYRGDVYCENCPGGFVLKTFDCFSKKYNFKHNPKGFYARIFKLDAKRKAS